MLTFDVLMQRGFPEAAELWKYTSSQIQDNVICKSYLTCFFTCVDETATHVMAEKGQDIPLQCPLNETNSPVAWWNDGNKRIVLNGEVQRNMTSPTTCPLIKQVASWPSTKQTTAACTIVASDLMNHTKSVFQFSASINSRSNLNFINHYILTLNTSCHDDT